MGVPSTEVMYYLMGVSFGFAAGITLRDALDLYRSWRNERQGR
jgi:hypothetical protein